MIAVAAHHKTDNTRSMPADQGYVIMPPMSDFKTVKPTKRLFANHISRLLVALLVVSVTLLGVIGCGASAPATTSSSTASWQALWKIGVVLPFSGYDATSAPNVLQAIKQVVHDANERGGINGHRLEVVSLDDGGSPDQARQQARLLASDPAVLGVIGHLQSDVALAAAPEYQKVGLPFFALRAPAAALTATEPAHVFRMGAPDQAVAQASVHYIREAGITTLLILSDGSAGHLSQANEVSRVARQAGIGVTTNVESVKIEPTQRDFTSLSALVSSTHAEAVFFAGTFQQASTIVGALERVKPLQMVLVGDEADCDGFKQLVASPAQSRAQNQGLNVRYVSAAGYDLATPDFDQRYQKAAGMAPLSAARGAHDATALLLAAVQKVANGERQINRAQLIAELRSGADFSGVTGPVKFDSFGNRLGAEASLYSLASGSSNPSQASLAIASLTKSFPSGNDHAK